MAIVIKTKREVDSSGTRGYKVLKIEALKFGDLPKLYCDGYPSVWKISLSPELTIRVNEETTLCLYENTFYTEEKMAERNTIIMEAGQRLHDINKHLARERAKWRGTVTFIDGKENPSSAKEEILSIKALRKEGRLYYRNKRGQIVPLKEEKRWA